MTQISGYHAHVYFDQSSLDRARSICLSAAQVLPVEMGRVHEKCVGPHPMWSCQLAFDPSALKQVLEWLVLNREGLIVFMHPDTGEHLQDHRDRAIWLGGYLPLDLSIFS